MDEHRRRKVTLAVCLALTTLTSLQCRIIESGDDGAAVSLEQAVELVVSGVVKPETLDHEVIVFSWPEPLEAGDRMEAYRLPETEQDGQIRTIERETWFFWIEDAPGALFAHRTRFVFVERASGELSVVDDLWWPVLNGDGLWVSSEAYWNEDNWAFSNLEWRPTPAHVSGRSSGYAVLSLNPHPIAPVLGSTPALCRDEAGLGAAIVINGWITGQTNQEDMETSADQMHDIFDDLGFDTVYYGPAEDDNEDRDGTVRYSAISAWFRSKAEEMGPCQPLFVYVTGHGMAEDGEGSAGGIVDSSLELWLERFNPGVHIVVIIDSCYAGSFIDNLRDVADLTITASDATSYSYSDCDPKNDPNSDDSGNEFTSGFVEDWNQILDDYDKVDRIKRRIVLTGENFWVALASEAFETALAKDAAALNGRSFPQIEWGDASTRPSTSSLPTPTPVSGTETYYVCISELMGSYVHYEGYSWVLFGLQVMGNPVPVPDATVNVRMTRPDGTSETVSAVTDLDGTAIGHFTIHVYGTYSLAVDSIEGESMVYDPTRNVVDSVVVEVGPSQGVAPDPATITTGAFFHTLNAAMESRDVDMLLANLHSVVVERYGTQGCRVYLEMVVEDPPSYQVLEVTEQESWTYDTDGRTTTLENVYRVVVDSIAQGETTRAEVHLAREDGHLRWFADCGDPLP
jgi:hypothetical protein